jgi:hypothetical protein
VVGSQSVLIFFFVFVYRLVNFHVAVFFLRLVGNGLHKTSKGMRKMNYQDTQQFERAKMLQLPIQPLLVLCGVVRMCFIINLLKQIQ